MHALHTGALHLDAGFAERECKHMHSGKLDYLVLFPANV